MISEVIRPRNCDNFSDKCTRNNRILDLFFTSNPTNINKVTTLPPIGRSNHDIVYIEIDTWLRRVSETPRKIYKFNNANCEKIASDRNRTLETLQHDKDKDVDTLWNTFKVNLITSIEQNIPSKMITYKHRLPWVTNELRKLINKKNRAYSKRKENKKNSKNSRRSYKKKSEQLTGNTLRK